jgi:hypothetical protein
MGDDMHPVHRQYANALASGEPAIIPLGRNVLCDACDTDLTDDPRSGGYLFGSYAYGPCCAERRLETIRGYGEEGHIRARCPEGVSFADWIRGLRGPDAAIAITPGTWRP